jgi:hypothetical protein
LNLVQGHNEEKEGYSIGINKFSDLSDAEFENLKGLNRQGIRLGAPMPLGANTTSNATKLTLPASVDWVKAKALGNVKN